MKIIFSLLILSLFLCISPSSILGQDLDDSYYSPQKVIAGKNRIIYGHISSNMYFFGGGSTTFDYSSSNSYELSSLAFGFNNIGFDMGQFVQLADNFAFSLSYQDYKFKIKLKDENKVKYPLEIHKSTLTTRLYFGDVEYFQVFGGFSYSPEIKWNSDYRAENYTFNNLYGLQLGIRPGGFVSYEGGASVVADLCIDTNFGKGAKNEWPMDAKYFNIGMNIRMSFVPQLLWKLGLYSFIEFTDYYEQLKFPDNEDRSFYTISGSGRFGIGLGW